MISFRHKLDVPIGISQYETKILNRKLIEQSCSIWVSQKRAKIYVRWILFKAPPKPVQGTFLETLDGMMNLKLLFLLVINLLLSDARAEVRCYESSPGDDTVQTIKSELKWSVLESQLKGPTAPKSIDQLVSTLTDHLDYWTAVYDSNSAQENYISPQQPRIILYGSDAKLVMTYASC